MYHELVGGSSPNRLTSPCVGFSPTTPQYDAGFLMDARASVPMDRNAWPAATAAPDPPLDPPVMWSVFHGLCVAPNTL